MTGDVFTFEEGAHRYTLNGQVLPSITQVLKLTGFVDDTWYRPEHAARGRAVHAACQFLLEGKLDWDTVHPEILTRVKAFERWLGIMRPTEIILSEKPLFSKLWGFAGTPDLAMKIGVRAILVDIKSGMSGLAAELQTAAQQSLINESMGVYCWERYALELTDRGKNAMMVPHGNTGDLTMFRNAVAMVKRRINKGEVRLT